MCSWLAGGRREMEADDEESCRMSSSSSLLLYCDEDPFADDSTPPPPPPAAISTSSGRSEGDGDHAQQQVVVDLNLVMEYKARERCYAPERSTGYLHRLHDRLRHGAGVSGARSNAVRYIIYAFGRLGLAAATAFNAVNYLDRFLSLHCHLSWEVWMVELVSVACLSVACKLDEVNIPSLHDLHMEEVMSHTFRASAIRDMELAMLKALQWRLACVTPYSYLDLLLSTATASSHRYPCTCLLLRSLSEPSFLRFDASVVAAAALRCVDVLQEHAHLIVPPLCQLDDDAEECFKMMKALDTSLNNSSMNHKHGTTEQMQVSPISVIPFEGSEGDGTVINRSAVSRRLFGTPTAHDR